MIADLRAWRRAVQAANWASPRAIVVIAWTLATVCVIVAAIVLGFVGATEPVSWSLAGTLVAVAVVLGVLAYAENAPERRHNDEVRRRFGLLPGEILAPRALMVLHVVVAWLSLLLLALNGFNPLWAGRLWWLVGLTGILTVVHTFLAVRSLHQTARRERAYWQPLAPGVRR